MTYLWIVGAILAGLVLLGVAYNVLWMIVEAIHPFTHRRVAFADLQDHVLALFRRGLNGSQMLITCEENGRQLRFRKTYKYGQSGLGFHLIVPAWSLAEPRLSEVVAAVDVLGLQCDVSGRGRGQLILDIDCLGSMDKATAAINIVLVMIVSASESSTFSICVRGGMFGVDGYIAGETTPSEIAAMYRCAVDQGDVVRPYKWESYCVGRGAWAKSLGAAVGRIAAWLFPRRR